MDNLKTGKIIALKRKQHGMTQLELGELVGVGFRAVSKWERGITAPDIAIISELSKILEISTDELLSGKLNNKNNNFRNISNKKRKKIKSIILALTVSTIITILILIIIKGTTAYSILAIKKEKYFVEGNVILKNKQLSVSLNKIDFLDKKTQQIKIKNYEYQLKSGDELLLGYGYVYSIDELSNPITILEFTKEFRVNYSETSKINKHKLENDGLILELTFLLIDDNVMEQTIEMKIIPTK